MPTETLDRTKNWQFDWRLDKWEAAEAFYTAQRPDETVEVRDNLLLNSGISLFLNLLMGASGIFAYGSTNARLKVGDSSGTVVASGTDLLGANTGSAGMDAGYPQVAAQTITWRATFDVNTGNFTWNEAGVINGSSAVSPSTVLLNRKIVTFGTKTNQNIWQLTGTLTIT